MEFFKGYSPQYYFNVPEHRAKVQGESFIELHKLREKIRNDAEEYAESLKEGDAE